VERRGRSLGFTATRVGHTRKLWKSSDSDFMQCMSNFELPLAMKVWTKHRLARLQERDTIGQARMHARLIKVRFPLKREWL
jgi:hypothetical protein